MMRMKHFAGSAWAAAGAAVLLSGCSPVVLLDPKGPIGSAERFVILAAFGLMLIVVIPVLAMIFWFPRKYRASNTRATYAPQWSRSAGIEWVIWLVPAVIVAFLGTLVWHFTYRLDPYKPIAAGAAAIPIEAVSLDWKWLFIYPDQHIATVNQLVFPAQVPLSFRLTSGSVMTSFFIPQLGSQIYAMAGMQTRLHLMADEQGVYAGQNQQFSGSGYAEMNFKATAVSREQFADWVRQVRQSPQRLDLARYAELARPSADDPAAAFSVVEPGLFEHILRQFGSAPHAGSGAGKQNPAPGPPNAGAGKDG